MKTKPYAWVNVNDEYKIIYDEEFANAFPDAWIPLYKRPKIKMLSNKEIEKVRDEFFSPKFACILTFADALLKKAQEK